MTLPSDTRGASARHLVLLVAPLAVGWLASGSCTVVACYEECDPCWQQCKCSGTCGNPAAGGAGARIMAHHARVVEASAERVIREIEVLDGPTVPEDPGAGPEGMADFARGVLAANAALFASDPDPRWRLEAVHALPGGTAVQFSLAPGAHAAPRSNSVTLLFDARGRLLEAAQIVERRTD
ncbi:MAG: hypothetical protein JNK02_17705 [Planctomycetes bacterium]|nr:hypothetical protein [Planctomycetota bacterium]